MRHPDISRLTSRLSRFPIGTLALAGMVAVLVWAYGRYHQKPVPSPTRQAAQVPAVRPRDTGKYVRVLAIDGGGMRSLLALKCLESLEKRSGRPACELFDVMVGTSSGAFVVAALSVPLERGTPRFTAAELIKEFPTLWAKSLQTPAIHHLLSLEGRTAPRYLTRSRQKVFQEFFGDTQVGAVLTTIILPAYSTSERAPFLFASDMGKSESFSGANGRGITEAGDYFLADAVTAATCNPADSAPSKITNSARDQTETLVGASLYASNPSLLALSEALLRYPGKQCVLISLGTGIPPAVPEAAAAAGWRKTGDHEEIVRFAAEASQASIAQIASGLHRFGTGPVAAYIRLDIPLPKNALPADDSSDRNVRELTALAEKLTAEKSATLNRTADFLGAQ